MQSSFAKEAPEKLGPDGKIALAHASFVSKEEEELPRRIGKLASYWQASSSNSAGLLCNFAKLAEHSLATGQDDNHRLGELCWRAHKETWTHTSRKASQEGETKCRRSCIIRFAFLFSSTLSLPPTYSLSLPCEHFLTFPSIS